MAVKFDTVKAGDTLYSVYRRKMGHTTMSETVCLPVRVVEIDPGKFHMTDRETRLHVGCYPKDETAARRAMIERANARLAELEAATRD